MTKTRKAPPPEDTGFLNNLHAAFHRPRTRVYKVVDGIVWALIIASLGLVALDIIAYHRNEPQWLRIVDRTILWIFAVELILRVLTCRPKETRLFHGSPIWSIKTHFISRLRHLLSPLQIFDLLVVLTLVPGLRGFRVLRFLRLARGLRIFRYSNPFLGIVRAFQENALLYFFTFSFLVAVVLLGGTTFYLIEAPVNGDVNNIHDGLWWALVTLTTVGYGDVTPASEPFGRLVAGIVMVLGMFTLAMFAGIVSSTLLRVLMNLRGDQFRMSNYANHIVICGYDESAQLLLNALLEETDNRQTEILVFAKGERPPELQPEFVWVTGDPSRESELDKVRVTHARTVIVVGSRKLPPSQADAATIMITFTIRAFCAKQKYDQKRNAPLYIVSEILDPENVDHARTAGADEVIETTRLGFSLMAHAAMVPGTGSIMSNVASAGALSLYIAGCPREEPLSYGDLTIAINDDFGAILLGIRNPETAKVTLDPDDNTVVQPSDELVYLARSPVLHKGK